MSQFCKEFLSLINLLATILNFAVPITDIKLFVGQKKRHSNHALGCAVKEKKLLYLLVHWKKNGVILT